MPEAFCRRCSPMLGCAPAVAIIYALPAPLKLPLQNLVLMFCALLLAHLNVRS